MRSEKSSLDEEEEKRELESVETPYKGLRHMDYSPSLRNTYRAYVVDVVLEFGYHWTLQQIAGNGAVEYTM